MVQGLSTRSNTRPAVGRRCTISTKRRLAAWRNGRLLLQQRVDDVRSAWRIGVPDRREACASCRVRARLGERRTKNVARRTTLKLGRLSRQTKVESEYYKAKARRREGAVVIRGIVQRERKPKGGGGDGVLDRTEARGDLHGQPRAGDAHL